MKITSKSNQLVFSGRIGPTVNYLWRGRWCARSLPSHYNDARTDAQLAQRSLFKQTVAFAARAKRVLKLGLRAESLKEQMTESNLFMKINKGRFAVQSDGTQTPRLRNLDPQPDSTTIDSTATPTLSIDYENLILACGPVAPVAFYEPQMLDATTISVDFEKNPLHRSTKSDDLVYLVAYCPELDAFDISTPVYRRSNHLEMSINEGWDGREVHLWGFVVDAAGRASMSQYIGSATLGDTVEAADEDTETNDIQQQAVSVDFQEVSKSKPISASASHRPDTKSFIASPPE